MSSEQTRMPLSVGYRRRVGLHVGRRIVVGVLQLPLGLLVGAAVGVIAAAVSYRGVNSEAATETALFLPMAAGLLGSVVVTGIAVYRIVTPSAWLRGDVLVMRSRLRHRRVHLAAAHTVDLPPADRALAGALRAGRPFHRGDTLPALTVTGPAPDGTTVTLALPLASREGIPLHPAELLAVAGAFGRNPAATDATTWLRTSAETHSPVTTPTP